LWYYLLVQRYPFIVLYGAPNLGKTVQAKLLAERLGAHYIKYPVYDLAPTGPAINAALRHGVPVTPLELQTMYAQNRRDYEPTLTEILLTKPVVGEAYIKTGIVNGLLEDVPRDLLDEINKDLRQEDHGILLDGERFVSGIEREHRFEMGDWEKTREIHRALAAEFGWDTVNANRSIDSVHADIFDCVTRKFV
jgi:thymidylate kinase